MPLTRDGALAQFQAMDGKSGQMKVEEYMIIADELLRRGPCNLLVFGAGKDSRVWARLNLGGRTVFVDDNATWGQTVVDECPTCSVMLVQYWTTLERDGGNVALVGDPALVLAAGVAQMHEYLGVPQDFKWDVIVVDGPAGWYTTAPGRMQSIATARFLAHGDTTVFVHDCQRQAEQWCVLSVCICTEARMWSMCVCVCGGAHSAKRARVFVYDALVCPCVCS